MKNKAFAKFWEEDVCVCVCVCGGGGTNKVHYGRCESGVCKGLTVAFYDCVKVENTLWFCDLFIF